MEERIAGVGGAAGSEQVVSCRNPSVGGAVDLLTDRYQTVPVQPAGTHLRVRRTKRPAERSSAGADSADVRSLLLLRVLAVASGALLERADAPADALHQFGNLAASAEQPYDQ